MPPCGPSALTVGRGNRELAHVEQVRRFTVLGRDFSQEEGELTPTLKVKRRVVEERLDAVIDGLYEEEPVDAAEEEHR